MGWFLVSGGNLGGSGDVVPSAGKEGGEVGFVGWHYVLEVSSGFVEEMSQDGAGDDVGGEGPAAEDGGFNDGHATVALEVLIRLAVDNIREREQGDAHLYDRISHCFEVVEAFLVCTDKKDGNLIFILRFIAAALAGFSVVVDTEKTNIHVQVALLIEARQAQRNPVISTPSFDTACFEYHVEDQLQVTRMEGVTSGSDNADESPASYN